MRIVKETIIAGRTIMQSLKPCTSVRKGNKRMPRKNPTSDAVKKVNKRNAERKLTALLNNNFKDGDYHLTLTYKGEAPEQKQAKDDVSKFLRNIRNNCKKQGVEFKYIQVTEYLHTRIHHHIVCTAIDPELLKRFWKKGGTNIKLLDTRGNYQKLAEYLIKETEQTFRLPDSASKRRWTGSRNLIMPEIKREEVSPRELNKEIKALKGYQIDVDSIRIYDHAFINMECKEWIQVSLDDEPRIKKWKRGKKAKFERHIKEDYELQEGFIL